MTTRSKRSADSIEGGKEAIPLSPITSPPRPLTKRQAQNRAAQRTFRERRAQTLKEMETRLARLEIIFDELSKSISKIHVIEKELIKLKESIGNLYLAVDSLTVPTWTVPVADELKTIEPEPIGAVLGALRPSSTDPTLTTNYKCP